MYMHMYIYIHIHIYIYNYILCQQLPSALPLTPRKRSAGAGSLSLPPNPEAGDPRGLGV